MKKLMFLVLTLALFSGTNLLAQDITGTWQGTLHAGSDLRIVVKFLKDGDALKVQLFSIDQGGQPLGGPATLQGSTVKFSTPGIGGEYEGKLDPGGSLITGIWTQGPKPLPLDLKRATAETAWEIPAPPPPMKPMDPNADPTFEVATIKPSDPAARGRFITVRGRRFMTGNTTLSSMMTFAYGVHSSQIVGAPAWVENDKFDINAQPDLDGRPNDKQLKSMLRKLITDRFKLKFENEEKQLPAYAILVGKTGPKLTKDEDNPNGLPGLFFRGLGDMPARNATMGDFAGLLQTAVMDRPVIDRTELSGRYGFELKWTPDPTQFASFGPRPPGPPPADDAPPDIFTAMQQQLGLKLESVKAPIKVMVISHVEKPSEN